MKNQESLKVLAKLAKNRLKNKDNNKSTSFFDSVEDCELAEKIFDILSRNKETLTPIRELIDFERFSKFSPLQREIYIFNLIDKYNYYKQIYEKRGKELLA